MEFVYVYVRIGLLTLSLGNQSDCVDGILDMFVETDIYIHVYFNIRIFENYNEFLI